MQAQDTIPLHEIFASKVTRDIPPVVYFHEQSPEKLQSEVEEYIITGGWREDHPNYKRVPSGIHDQYVRLITGITTELDKPGGPELPAAWISGFYGSGKSSFAKLFGLALDGVALPDGTALSEAWLKRDTSQKSEELVKAWKVLKQKIDPIAVVFDIGGVARDNEHIHAAAVRQVQARLGYCKTEPLVADFELKLERDGEWARFETTALEVLGKPWKDVKDRALAEEEFSLVMSVMFPDRYTDPMAWFMSRGGTHTRSESPEEAVAAIGDMLKYRRSGATLFLVIDEVSQYVLSHTDRIDRLRAFATALGAGLKGRAWLLALGQQKLDEHADDSFLVWARDRFPQRLQVHLATTNIRDVVHKRLLQKKPEMEARLRALFDAHRAELKLYAFNCEEVTPDEFVEVYPMLPGQIDLILQITSQLRTRSARAQGDDQAIRGLLQLLGELFRDQKLANEPLGALVTLDRIYEVQHTALDSDVQTSMERLLSQCDDELAARCAKAVALLELIQETRPTDARLVAQCLYDRLDTGNRVSEVTAALEELRRRNLLSYSEKLGYKLQSSAGEDWERERREQFAGREQRAEILQEALKYLLALPDRPRLQGRPFSWAGLFSDGRRLSDAVLHDPHDYAAIRVDFRYLPFEDRTEAEWLRRSGEVALRDRLVWISGETQDMEAAADELFRSRAMVKRHKPRRESLTAPRKLLLQQEENRAEDLEPKLREVVATAYMTGKLYFRGRSYIPLDLGPVFPAALLAAGTRVLPDLFPHFVATQLQPSEVMQLVEPELSGLSPKLLEGDLGIVGTENRRFMAACSGVVPQRVLEFIEKEQGVGGTSLLAYFGAPPFGYAENVVKACVAGLLRAGKLRVLPEGGTPITAVRDAGVKDLFEKDRSFRRATITPHTGGGIGVQTRAKLCKFFEEQFGHPMEREDHAIADAVAQHFPGLSKRLREVLDRLDKLPAKPKPPAELERLTPALEASLRNLRQTEPTVLAVAKHLDALRDGLQTLKLYDAELTDGAIKAVHEAGEVRRYQAAQLQVFGATTSEAAAAIERLDEHLSTERPWRDIASVASDLKVLREAYAVQRGQLLNHQEQLIEQARGRVKAREGFATLTADHAHQVLKAFTTASPDTDAEAVAPRLDRLRDDFELSLHRAEERANQVLDELLSDSKKVAIVPVDLKLRHREIRSADDVDRLLAEIRERLLKEIAEGRRIRLS